MKKQKKVLLITVLCVIALMGIVYAAFTALTLKVNTTATASASIFSVGFDDVEPTIVKSNDNITVDAIAPTEGETEITVSVNGLKAPGDYAEVDYIIINNGDVDATNIQALVGPALSGDSSWEQDFNATDSWISNDGVFQFTVSRIWGGESDWTDEASTNELSVGKKGKISVHVQLLKRVDTDTTGSCTMKIIATPGNLEV